MSKKRYIDTKFWSDGYIDELDPIEKLLFLYLLTNERTNVAGIYELPRKMMAVETGIEISMLNNIITRFERDGKIVTFKKWVRLANSESHQNINNHNIKVGIKNVLDKLPTEVKDRLYMSLEDPSRDSNNLDLDLDLDLNLDLDSKGAKAPEKNDEVSKAYYETVKELKIPIRNHNNLRTKINELEKEIGTEDAMKYLTFLKMYYNKIPDDGFKPRINESIDIYAKRVSIASWIERMQQEHQELEVI